MGLKVTVEPTDEPVTLAEAKLHARIDVSDDDDLVTSMIVAARQSAEQITERALALQTVTLYLDDWPAGGDVELPRPPLAAISSVQYVDGAGDLQVIDSANYAVDTNRDQDRAWLLPAYGYEWPAVLAVANAVRVTYTCGYTQAACPAAIKAYILASVAAMYAQREVAGDRQVHTHRFIDALLDRYKVWVR